MAQTLRDFTALKGLRKEMEKQEQSASPKPVAEQKEVRTVHHQNLEEEHALNIGIEKGARVRMMDTNDTGIIVGIGKGFYEIELDGLVFRAVRSEFIPIDEAQDRKMCASIPSGSKKHTEKKRPSNPAEDLVVDLHLDRIPGNERVPEWAALEYQMSWFRKILRENLKHRGKRIVFIHGDGDGTLNIKSALASNSLHSIRICQLVARHKNQVIWAETSIQISISTGLPTRTSFLRKPKKKASSHSKTVSVMHESYQRYPRDTYYDMYASW